MIGERLQQARKGGWFGSAGSSRASGFKPYNGK